MSTPTKRHRQEIDRDLKARGVVARPLVTLHLPIDMGCSAAILQAVSQWYPNASVGADDNGDMTVLARENPKR
jgi:hypothetical protein